LKFALFRVIYYNLGLCLTRNHEKIITFAIPYANLSGLKISTMLAEC